MVELGQVLNSAIKDRRTDMGLTQRGLAYKAGIDNSTISRLEANKRFPMLKTATAISQALRQEALIPGDRQFGEYLRTNRELSKLVVRELARLSGVNHVTILRLERGKQEPSLTVARKLATVFSGQS